MEIRTAAPRIPDHEVLRCIGKGSYGEVWLARAVTGTLRAVKVVLDPMQTGPAIRTYNIMIGERRRVAAALIAVA